MIEDYRENQLKKYEDRFSRIDVHLDTFHRTRNERMVVRGLRDVGGAEMEDVGDRA